MEKESLVIELFEGVPGSGKSYHCVAEKLLPWVRSGRRLYVRLNGFHHDRLAAFTGLAEDTLREQITLLETEGQIFSLHSTVEPGAAVVIDEAQNFFRSMTRPDPALLRWLESHRHFGVDILSVLVETVPNGCIDFDVVSLIGGYKGLVAAGWPMVK